MQTAPEPREVDVWRQRLSRRAVVGLASTSVLGVLLVELTHPSPHLLAASRWVFIPVTALLWVAVFVGPKRWKWQALLAVLALLFFGFSGVASLGFLGGPAVVFCVALLLCALLLGRPATWVMLALMVCGVTLIALFMHAGLIAAPDPHDTSFARPEVWLRSGGIALLVLAVIAMTVAVVIENLEAALSRAQLETVARERAERERAQALRVALEAQKLETVGRLAAGVAHDFNNALCVIDMCTQQLGRGARDASERETLRTMIAQSVAQASSLARQMLLLSRRHVPAPTRIDLRTFVEELAATLPRILPSDVSIDVKLDAGNDDDLAAFADRVQVQHALLNLALNARDAMPNGGRMSLRAGKQVLHEPQDGIGGPVPAGAWIVLEVEDSGGGMDEATRARAFEPFFTTKATGHGTGLGLSSVLTSMELSGGHVSLWSEPGRGTRVTLWLAPAATQSAAPEIAASSEHVSLVGRTVFIAEDSASVLQLLREVLTDAGCTVITARDGTDALEQLAAHAGRIDVLCTDVVMPGAPVRELLGRFAERHPGAPILILSGYVADDLALRGIVEGRYQQLPKPFTADQLLSAVQALVDRPH